MPSFSKKSASILETCHPKLQQVFNEVVKTFDCTIISGHRPPEEQFKLFQKGRIKDDLGNWLIVKREDVVTYKDGYEKLSKHNYRPSLAVDVVPYPVEWDNKDRMIYFAGFVKGVSEKLGFEIVWGGDWDADTDMEDQTFKDLPHYQLKGE